MLNWRDAIQKAQRKIDAVLDIRPEETDSVEPVLATRISSADTDNSIPEDNEQDFEQEDIEDVIDEQQIEKVVKVEPLLPPGSRSRFDDFVGDEILTIVSSDIEVVPRNDESSAEVSPQSVDFNNTELLELRQKNDNLTTQLVQGRIRLAQMEKELSGLSAVNEKKYVDLKSEAEKSSQEAYRARQEYRKLKEEIKELKSDNEKNKELACSRQAKIESLKKATEGNQAIIQDYIKQNGVLAENAKSAKEDAEMWKQRCEEIAKRMEEVLSRNDELEDREKLTSNFGSNASSASIDSTKAALQEALDKSETLSIELRKANMRIEQIEIKHSEQLSATVAAASVPFMDEILSLKQTVDDKASENIRLQRQLITAKHLFKNLENNASQLKRETITLRKDVEMLGSISTDNCLRIHNATKQVERDTKAVIRDVKENYRRQEKVEIREFATQMTQTELLEKKVSFELSEDEKEKNVPLAEQQSEAQSQEQILPQPSEIVSDFIKYDSPLLNSSIRHEQAVHKLFNLEQELARIKDERDKLKTENQLMSSRLGEVLEMHGEKIEQVEELKIDIEDLRSILREQALTLSSLALQSTANVSPVEK